MKKPSILLISGWAHGAEAMVPLAEAMSDSHQVTSLSLAELLVQGKGEDQNGPGDRTASISPYARAIALHLDKSGGAACIVGWSTGSIAAIEAAANYPEKVAGLVLLSATARFCSARGSSAKDSSAEAYSAGVAPVVLRAMIRRMKTSPEAVIADFLSQALHPVHIPADELALRTEKALNQGVYSLSEGLEYLARVDLRDALPAITIPCLIIHGRQDGIVPWQAAQFLASNLQLSNVEFLPSAGHSLIEQCGKDLINRIIQFPGLLR